MKTVDEVMSFMDKLIPFELGGKKDKEKAKSTTEFLIRNLHEEEDIKFAFWCYMSSNGASITAIFKVIVVLITTERILYGHNVTGLIATPLLKSISLKSVNDITIGDQNNKFAFWGGDITIDTMKEETAFTLPRAFKGAREKYDTPPEALRKAGIINIINEIRDNLNGKEKSAAPASQPLSGADEILKYKQLLDDGIITEEEFQAKKKQILGI